VKYNAFEPEKGGGRSKKKLDKLGILHTVYGEWLSTLERRTGKHETKVYMHPDDCSISVRGQFNADPCPSPD
jgi:hypothetical protein